jgi:hypothetical protein
VGGVCAATSRRGEAVALAGLLGVALVLLFATLLMLADAKAMSIKRANAESRYAVPTVPPIERSSMIPAVQVVSDGGW